MPDNCEHLHPVDEHIRAQTDTGFYVTPELFGELLDGVQETTNRLRTEFSQLSERQAHLVRALRVDQGCSWRMVAEECYEAWGGSWAPPSNQIVGMILCEAAAPKFGEDANAEPWN